MNLFLIGYRGSGKTTVAAALAERLGWPWIDADAELERRAGKIDQADLCRARASRPFATWNRRSSPTWPARDEHVIALGGGAVLREENREAIAGRGKVVWLQASPETLLERINADPTTAERRPNLTGQGGLAEIRELLAERTPLYAACADLTVDAERQSPDRNRPPDHRRAVSSQEPRVNAFLALPLALRLAVLARRWAGRWAASSTGRSTRWPGTRGRSAPGSGRIPRPRRGTWSDFVPVLGWLGLRARSRRSTAAASGFGRCSIELACGVGLPALYWWEIERARSRRRSCRSSCRRRRPCCIMQFVSHAILIGLMLVATFIDFDEKTIPDEITIPGTLLGLLLAAVWPDSHLPVVRLLVPPAAVATARCCSPRPSDWPAWLNDVARPGARHRRFSSPGAWP